MTETRETRIEIAAQVRRETEKPLLIFDGVLEVWVPKALVEVDADADIIWMPEWLAIEKELI